MNEEMIIDRDLALQQYLNGQLTYEQYQARLTGRDVAAAQPQEDTENVSQRSF